MPGETEQQRKLRMCTLPRHERRTGNSARQPPSNATVGSCRLRLCSVIGTSDIAAPADDMDQSGELDRVEEHIAKYDTNKDGTFSVAEVKAIVEELEKEEQQTKALKKVPAPAPAPADAADP